MKKSMKWFIVGFVMACLMIVPMAAFADEIQVTLNSVNVNLSGTQVAAKGQSYTLENGTAIPYSLNYNGTVYLPIRKVSELVGKDISYDGTSSTITILDKKTTESKDNKTLSPVVDTKDNKTPVPEKKETTDSDDNVKKDPVADTSEKSKDTSKVKTKSGCAVINSFPKMKNESGIQVNKLKGFIDGTAYSLPTSKKDMITLSNTVPSVYSVKYNDKVITEMDEVSLDVTDTVKEYSEANSIVGDNGTYETNSNAVCYKVLREDDGSIDAYAVTRVSSVKAGWKVYLYDTDAAKGYDIVLIEKK